jgi:hypothetical protein
VIADNSALNRKTANRVTVGHCLANRQILTLGYARPMRRVFLDGWLLLALELGCGGVTQRAPAGGSGAPADPAPSSPTEPTCSCVAAELAWWKEGGGRVPYIRESLTGCRSYALQRMGKPTTWCGSELACRQARVGVGDLNAALEHPDVTAALLRAPALFGSDPRALDGQVDHLEVGGKVLELGESCETDDSCNVPPGLTTLRELLANLTLQEEPRLTCDTK